MTILELHRQGLSISGIAARLEMDRKTVRKYIKDGVQAPRYGPRQPRPCVMDPFVAYVTERVRAFPELSIERLLREIRAMGYAGGRSALGEIVRDVRPPRRRGFEVRFETAAGEQAQVDFAHFSTNSTTLHNGDAQSGYSRSYSDIADIFGGVLSNTRICKRSCDATWKHSSICAACRMRFCTTG